MWKRMIIRAWPLRRAPGTRNEDGMRLQSKMFHELTTRELYEILKARAEIFVVEQNYVYQDLDDRTGRQTSWFISGLGVRFYGSCFKAHGKKGSAGINPGRAFSASFHSIRPFRIFNFYRYNSLLFSFVTNGDFRI